MKKSITLSILAVLLLGFGLLAYRFTYPIASPQALSEEEIVHFYNIGRQTPLAVKVTLYDSVTLGRSTYRLLEISDWTDIQLGGVILEHGPLGRCRIASLSYGGGNFLYGIVTHDGHSYALLGGRDITEQIARISAVICGEQYDFVVNNAHHFLTYVEFPSYIEDNHLDLDTVRLYNAAGEDITENYDLSGGGF